MLPDDPCSAINPGPVSGLLVKLACLIGFLSSHAGDQMRRYSVSGSGDRTVLFEYTQCVYLPCKSL